MATPKAASSTVKTPSSSARPKKISKSQIIILRLSPQLLKAFPASSIDSPIKSETEVQASLPIISNGPPADTSSPAENVSESNSNTPVPTSDGAAMPPPAMKKAPKRSLAAADGLSKSRSKPGPKKKAKLDDGTAQPTTTAAAHKLGPKANQGAINAGLRALDRTGKQCRKWQKGGFAIKSFTGAVWNIPRWTAPPKPAFKDVSNGTSGTKVDGSSPGDSSKENKDSSQAKSDQNSTNGIEADSKSAQSIPASSPAPLPMPVSVA